MKKLGVAFFICIVSLTVFLLKPASYDRAPASRLSVDHWKLVGVFPLASASFHTGHPQGLNISNDTLTLSYAATRGTLNFYRLTRGTSGEITTVNFTSAMAFSTSKITHPGGLGRSQDRKTLYVPLAGGPLDETVVVMIENGQTKTLTRYPFHVGAVFLNNEAQVLYGVGRDPGFKIELYGHTVYPFDLKTGSQMPPVTHEYDEQFQDCKPVHDGEFLCSNKFGSNAYNLSGSVDLVKFERDGHFTVVQRTPVPHVNLDGSFAALSGAYVPGWYGTPPLSYNAFDFEKIGNSVYFYFVPNDDPDTRLYIYRVSL